METGLYPHPWPSIQPLIVQSGMYDSQSAGQSDCMQLTSNNFMHVSVRDGWAL